MTGILYMSLKNKKNIKQPNILVSFMHDGLLNMPAWLSKH